jgi:hypothetical protein
MVKITGKILVGLFCNPTVRPIVGGKRKVERLENRREA